MERRRRTRRPLSPDQLLGIANYLTYARIATVPVVVLLLMGIKPELLERNFWNVFLSWTSLVVFVLAQISDIVDGYYARKYNVISSFGKFVDPLADKLMSMSVLIMLIPLGRVQAWIVVLLIAREVTITALRGIAASEGIEISASDWGKKKTVIQSIAIGFLLVHYPFWQIDPQKLGDVFIGVTLLVSVGSGVHYVWMFFSEVFKTKS